MSTWACSPASSRRSAPGPGSAWCPPWTAAVPALFGWARPPCRPPTPFHPHRSRSECYERAEAGPGADTGDHPERVSGPDARPGDGRLRHELLGLGAAQPARAEAEGLAAPDLVPTGADRRRTGDRGRPGPRPGWSPHRQAGRPGDVSCRVVRNHRAGAVPGLRRTLLVCRPACRRFLPRYRGNRLRGRRAVRQRVVRPRASRHGHRCLRGRHGRDGDQRADDGQALGGARHRRPVRADRRRAGGVRRGGDAAAARRPRTPAAHAAGDDAAGGCAAHADHLASLGVVCGYLRRLRGLLRLPPDVPEDGVRPGSGRCGEPHGGLRPGGGADAAGGWLAVRPVHTLSSSHRCTHRGRDRRCGPGNHPGADTARDCRFPVDGGRAGRGGWRGVRSRRPT